MQQDGEVADFLRNLVGNDGQRSHNPQMHINQKGRGDDDAINKVVESIADDNHRPAATVIVICSFVRLMRFAVFVMAVAPDQHFLQREKQQYANQHHATYCRQIGRLLESLGQNVEEYGTQQRTDGITHQPAKVFTPCIERKQRSRYHAQDAAQKAGDDDPGQDAHAITQISEGRGLYPVSPDGTEFGFLVVVPDTFTQTFGRFIGHFLKGNTADELPLLLALPGDPAGQFDRLLSLVMTDIFLRQVYLHFDQLAPVQFFAHQQAN